MTQRAYIAIASIFTFILLIATSATCQAEKESEFECDNPGYGKCNRIEEAFFQPETPKFKHVFKRIKEYPFYKRYTNKRVVNRSEYMSHKSDFLHEYEGVSNGERVAINRPVNVKCEINGSLWDLKKRAIPHAWILLEGPLDQISLWKTLGKVSSKKFMLKQGASYTINNCQSRLIFDTKKPNAYIADQKKNTITVNGQKQSTDIPFFYHGNALAATDYDEMVPLIEKFLSKYSGTGFTYVGKVQRYHDNLPRIRLGNNLLEIVSRRKSGSFVRKGWHGSYPTRETFFYTKITTSLRMNGHKGGGTTRNHENNFKSSQNMKLKDLYKRFDMNEYSNEDIELKCGEKECELYARHMFIK